jgi:polyhydroxybutyrate depolymerase
MRHRIAMLLGVVLVIAGCAVVAPKPPSGFVDGASIHTISVGGRDRVYRLHKPSGLPASASLVVVLHGGFGSAEQAERSYGWDQLADSAKFVAVYPDGVKRAWNVNGGGCCGRPAQENIDDVGFISAVVANVAKNIGIDASRVYATGMSNGGIMSYTLACNTTLFAAIGPVAGTQLDPCRSPHAVSVMAVHGTADPMVPYGGGPGHGFAHIDGLPIPELNALWRRVDQCQAPTETTDGQVTTSTAGCAEGRGVALVTVADGGHHWPDFATDTLWEFFAGQHR